MAPNIHAALILEYAKDWAETDEPWTRWEFSSNPTSQRAGFCNHPTWKDNLYYFRKPEPPKFILINGFEVPEPEREPLKKDEEYYTPNLLSINNYSYQNWDNANSNMRYLESGLVHKTEEAAILHSKALLSITTNK